MLWPPHPQSHLLSVDFVEVFIEQLLYVLQHRGQADVDNLGGLRGVGIVEGILNQATLATVQMLDSLLAYHDLLRWVTNSRYSLMIHSCILLHNIYLDFGTQN